MDKSHSTLVIWCVLLIPLMFYMMNWSARQNKTKTTVQQLIEKNNAERLFWSLEILVYLLTFVVGQVFFQEGVILGFRRQVSWYSVKLYTVNFRKSSYQNHIFITARNSTILVFARSHHQLDVTLYLRKIEKTNFQWVVTIYFSHQNNHINTMYKTIISSPLRSLFYKT